MPVDLDQQIETLIREAPQDGATPALVSAIAPALKALAEQLKYREYYILQNMDEHWLSVTLQQPSADGNTINKTIISAYATLKDATVAYSAMRDPNLMALPIPVIDLLFRLNGMESIDSVIFYDTGARLQDSTELYRAVLVEGIQTHFQSLAAPAASLPPDIA